MAINLAFGSMSGKIGYGALIFLLSACSDGVPVVVKSHELLNPSGKLVATVEIVDNGLGFGQGALYDEIHLSPPGTSAFHHGDNDPSVAYYAESTYEKGYPPRIEWVSDTVLKVTIDPLSKAGRQKSTLNGISIEYHAQDRP